MADTDNTIPEVDAPDIEERGISQVAGPSRQTNPIVIGIGLVVVVTLLWLTWQGESRARTDLVDTQPEEFKPARKIEAPSIPKAESAPAPPEPIEPKARPKVERRKPTRDPYLDEIRRLALKQAQEAQKRAAERMRSPMLVFDENAQLTAQAQTSGSGPLLMGATTSASAANSAAANIAGSNEAFASAASNAKVATASARFIESTSNQIIQGTMIRGVLETAIQSDLPGFIRAQVSDDVYSFDGAKLLIPKASRLIGQYRSGLVRGQTRLFVIWTRVVRPDGASIAIGSPGTDTLGRAGLSGDLDTHFFKRFGASVLLSLIDGAIAREIEQARTQPDNSVAFENSADALNRAAEIALDNAINIPPTIHVDQGTPIQVFVAQDLDFQDVERG